MESSPYTWVVRHPLFTADNQGSIFHCSSHFCTPKYHHLKVVFPSPARFGGHFPWDFDRSGAKDSGGGPEFDPFLFRIVSRNCTRTDGFPKSEGSNHWDVRRRSYQAPSIKPNQVKFNQIQSKKPLNSPKFHPKHMTTTLWQVTILETNSGDQPASPKELVLKRPLGRSEGPLQKSKSGNSPHVPPKNDHQLLKEPRRFFHVFFKPEIWKMIFALEER